MRVWWIGVCAAVLWTGCPKDEGPIEKAGREFDAAADQVEDKARELSGEGSMERFGRKMDDAADSVEEAIDDAVDAVEGLGK